MPASRPRTRLRIIGGIVTAALILAVGLLAILARQPQFSAAAQELGLSTLATPVAHPTATATPPGAGAVHPLDVSQQGCGLGTPGPFANVLLDALHPGSKLRPNEVALTFDDGPTSYSSPKVLDVLEQTHTPATFFVEGQWALKYPDLVRREWRDGFAIGMHSWDHPNLTLLSDDVLHHQLADSLAQIKATIGGDPCLWLWRPPYGSYNQRILNAAQNLGLTTVNWDDTGFDWQLPGAPVIANNVLTHAHPGAIILLHDGPAAREQTAAAIPLILDGLKARGLTPVTLPRLMQDSGYPGVLVSTLTPTLFPTPTATP